jgi:hypothetical protein
MSTVTGENPTHTVEKVSAGVSSKKRLTNEEVRSWLAQQGSLKRAPIQVADLQTKKKKGRPVGSSKK